MPTVQSHSSTQSNMSGTGEYATSFEERRPKILEICRDLWPGAAISITSPGDRDCSVEEYFIAVIYSSYLEGMNQHLNHDRYVLQIPPQPGRGRGSCRVPGPYRRLWWPRRPVADPGGLLCRPHPDNPLGRPYLILTQHPGCSLGKVYQDMSQEQKVKVATELGRAFCEVQVDPAPFCGYPSTDPNEDDGEGRCIKPFQIKKHDTEADNTDWDAMINSLPTDVDHTEEDPAAALTRASFPKDGTPHLKARQLVRLSFLRWIHHNRRSSSSSSAIAPWKRDANERLLQRSLTVVEEITRRNPDVFDSDHICLHNPALGAAENIMVEFAGDEGRERGWRAPDHGFPSEEEEEEEEETARFAGHRRAPDGFWRSFPEAMPAGVIGWYPRRDPWEPLVPPVRPTHAAAAEAKRAFDAAVGPAFCQAAYNPEVVFARRFYAAAKASSSPWGAADYEELAELLVQWEERERVERGRGRPYFSPSLFGDDGPFTKPWMQLR
ncbi:uncharacterized protein PG986_013754 [Apiospora aurea]|uniref:Uncharacterized protein n=1 Tax=Apiospora aurea TaxID=335848 RepID=A0ABR1PWF5_9PEZI